MLGTKINLGRCNTLFLVILPEARQACEFRSIVFNPAPSMPSTRFEPSSIKNKTKRQEIVRKLKREKGQRKLQSRLAMAKAEIADPAAKRVRLPSSRPRVICQMSFVSTPEKVGKECPQDPRQPKRVRPFRPNCRPTSDPGQCRLYLSARRGFQ